MKYVIIFFIMIMYCFVFLFKVKKCGINEGIWMIVELMVFFVLILIKIFKFLLFNFGNGWYVLIFNGVSVGKIFNLNFCFNFFINVFDKFLGFIILIL